VCFAGLVGIFYALVFSLRRAPWPLSDWLTNYEGGFVRRGLPGEVLLEIARLTHVPIEWTVAALQISCLLCLIASMWWLVGRVFGNVTPIWAKALLLSPATLAFFWFDPGLILRKEIILFAMLGVLMLLLRWDANVSDLALTLFLVVCCPLLLLSHEGLVCYMPYVFALVALGRKSVRQAVAICAIPAVVSLFPIAAAMRYTGNRITADLICRSVGGPSTGLCTGPMYYLAMSRTVYEAEVRSLLHDTRMMIVFGTTTVLALIPVIAGLVDLWRKPVSRQTRSVVPLAFALSAIASSVLFLEAQDWTRWIYIHLVSLLLVLFFAVEQRQSTDVAVVRRSPLSVLKRTAIVLLLIVYATAWHLPEWILPGAREYKPFGYGSLLLRLQRHTSQKMK